VTNFKAHRACETLPTVEISSHHSTNHLIANQTLLPLGREVKLWVKPQYGAKMRFSLAPFIITLGVISATEISFV